MRKRIAAGNWKMNLRFDEAVSLVNDVLKNQKTKHNIIFAPPFPYLKAIAELCSSYPEVYVAAQNCSNELSGAYTGEVSVGMLESIGVNPLLWKKSFCAVILSPR